MNAPEPRQFNVAPATLRAANRFDSAGVALFLARMDPEGLYERHFAHGEAPNLALLGRLGQLDGVRRHASVAVDAAGNIVGHAEYVADGDEAEYAMLVLPGWRDRGLGRALLQALIKRACDANLRTLHGMILATNTRAIALTRGMGFKLQPGDDRRTVIVSCRLSEMPALRAARQSGLAVLPQETLHHDPDRTSIHRRTGA